MIKINLLDSVTDRARGVAVVEQRVASPFTQTIVMAAAATALLAILIVWDYTSANSEKAKAQAELENQQRIAAQMEAINKERAELEQRTKDIKVRIDAIQKLRDSQQGPGALLTALRDRLASVPGIYLESVSLKGTEVEIKGSSPNERAVTSFGQRFEGSGDLFSNLFIETQRKEVEASAVQNDASDAGNKNAVKRHVMNFTIKFNYKPPSNAVQSTTSAANTSAANQLAQN